MTQSIHTTAQDSSDDNRLSDNPSSPDKKPTSLTKVNVLGTSGSGKSTFAKALAEKLGCDYIEMDALFWLDDWQHVSDEVFFAKIAEALAKPSWVLDGNYTRTIPVKWQDVDTVIWLNYPFWLVLRRALKRAITRNITRQKLWNTNNVESLKRLFSKDSIVLWTIKTHKKNRVKVSALMQDERYRHIRFIEFTSPKQAQVFLDNIR